MELSSRTEELFTEMFTGMEEALHDLCQPLTVLQCKLEIGLLRGGEEAAHKAVLDGLRECKRLNAAVTTMRDLMRQRQSWAGQEAGQEVGQEFGRAMDL
jgi:signal transduction histidine kinase